MNPETLPATFHQKLSAKVDVVPEGINRYRVYTPFVHDDGDHLSIILKRSGDEWVLSDDGSTYMRLTYSINDQDLKSGNRLEFIQATLSAFSVEERDGELFVRVGDENVADALYSLIQAMLKISDVTFLSRERVSSTFLEDVRSFITSVIPTDHWRANWHDPQRDPDAHYVVDYRVNGSETPLFVYALNSSLKIARATTALHQLERWGIPHRSVGIYDEYERLNPKDVARFMDISEKQFSTLHGNEDRIRDYLERKRI